MAVKVDGLAAAVAEVLHEYREETAEAVKSSVKSSARVCVAELQTSSPELTGSYKKGWRVKNAYESDSDIRVQVHNKTDYQLTHLLEHGHANVNGGLTPGTPHIGPASDKAAELLEKDVKMKVGLK